MPQTGVIHVKQQKGHPFLIFLASICAAFLAAFLVLVFVFHESPSVIYASLSEVFSRPRAPITAADIAAPATRSGPARDPSEVTADTARQAQADLRAYLASYATATPRPTQRPIQQPAGARSTLRSYTASPNGAIQSRATTYTERQRHYVLNESTKVFHDPDCYQARRITDSMVREVYAFRADLVLQGYRPCSTCDP